MAPHGGRRLRKSATPSFPGMPTLNLQLASIRNVTKKAIAFETSYMLGK